MAFPTTRAEAKALGEPFYFTGKPCVRGHLAPRKTKGICIECMREDWIFDNERRKEKPKTAAAKEAGKRYYAKNKELVKARAAARPSEEKRHHQEKHKSAKSEYYKALTSVRRRRHRSATPKWITPEQKLAMRRLYLTAMHLTEATGERYVVDHIVPLINPVVCGLHVPWNLRVITQSDNLKKSNLLLDSLPPAADLW